MTEIENQKWIHIHMGNNDISKDEWEQIKNSNYQNKPTGGLWLSKYNGEDHNICEWLNFLQDETCEKGEYSDLYQTAISYKGGFLIELIENSKIAVIKNEDDLNYFMKNFLLSNMSLNYEKIAKVYDALYLQLFSLPIRYWSKYEDNDLNFKSWGCNTLLLFNYNIIKSLHNIDFNTITDIDGRVTYMPVKDKVYRKEFYERKGIN